MLNTKRSLTVKVVAGYVIVSILAGLAVWYIYNQVLTYSEIAQTNTENTQQLILVSEISTNLNESENTSRRLIQTGNEEELQLYNSQIDSIKSKIDELEKSYTELDFEDEADSIYQLLEQKTENLKELVALRDTDRNTNYYRKALGELRNIDQSFQDYNYENRFRNLKSYQKDVLVKWLEYSREDNAENITTQRLDSLVKSVKRVLTDLEFANRQFQNEVVQKENELLNNDMILNQQLQGLLSNLEKSERKNSLERAETFQNMLDKTSTIILIGSCIIILIILYFIINIIGDITRSQRYRVQLEEAKNFAESLLASREQFMAAITHDLRSPLTTVMGYTDLIQKTDLDEKQAYYLKQIKKSSEFILRLVNDLLDLSKLEAGKMLIEKLAFQPEKLIEDTVNNIIPAERTKNVSIEINVAPEAQVQLVSDPFRIKQILANLISNAWKFTEEGSIIIAASLVKPKKNQEILELRVRDSGIGISKEKQDSIFEEFSQEDNSIEKKFGGTGLGLAITRRLAHLLEGDIRVESEPGEGSEFIINIPVEKYQSTNEVLEESADMIAEKNYAASGLKALVIDDEPGQLSLTVELSKSMGFEIDTAANGKIALEKINEKEYDLILTDIQMPVLDGFELIKSIRSTDEIMHLPVIALSGRTDLEKQVYMDAGFDDKLLKPYKSATLKHTIAEVLDLEHHEPISGNEQAVSKAPQTGFYDLSEIYEFAGKDDDAFKEIISAFIEGTRESMNQLQQAWESTDKDSLGKTAHRMLPMLKQMQAQSVTQDLLLLEERKNIDETSFTHLMEKLEKLVSEIEEEIKA